LLKRATLLVAVALYATCGWETKEPGEWKLIARYVLEEDFRSVHLGMAGDQVVAKIGAPQLKIQTDGREVWDYTVWRGEKPGILRALLSSKPLKAELLKAEVTFVGGRVSSAATIESTAVPFSPRESTSAIR
jgi:hypothetical protein